MPGLGVRFDLGRFHATPWGSHVNDAAVEWPPSPWRVLRALYAVSRCNTTLQASQGPLDAALASLVAAGPPIYRLPPSFAAHTRHYMPRRSFSPTRQGHTDRIFDGFVALSPEAELEIWWDTKLDPDAESALAAAAEALGYLGRSESVCTARLLNGSPPDRPDAAPLERAVDGYDGDTQLMCVDPSMAADVKEALASLEVSITELRRRHLRQPPGTAWIDYGLGAKQAISRPAPSLETPTLAWFRIRGGSRPGMREAVAVADALRAALQARVGRATRTQASEVFSGRTGDQPRQEQHRHAHFLALPEAHGPRIDHMAVWAPEGFGPLEVTALAGLRSLRIWKLPEPLPVALAALGRTSELRIPHLLGPSMHWRSLTPFGLTRHPKRRRGAAVDTPADQVKRELDFRGLPVPERVELIRGPWLEFRRSRPRSSRLEAARVVGVELSFSSPVRGPIALGALSHFGLGLFVPQP